MNKIYRVISGLSMIVSFGFIFGSCVADPNSPGLEYMPDMYRSPAIEPYVDYGELRGVINKNVAGKMSALTPPVGTIPYYGTNEEDVLFNLPYKRLPGAAFAKTHGLVGYDFSYNEDSDYEYKLAAEDKNPMLLTENNAEAIFKQAKTLYASKCMHCHGDKGDGNGPMVKSGAYTGVPDYKNVSTLSDGQIFYSIYYGKGAMGSHASILNKKEIWTLVHYVRKFQDDKYGSFGVEEVAQEESNNEEVTNN